MTPTRRDFLKAIGGKAFPNIRDFGPSAHKKRLAAMARFAAATRSIGLTTIDAAKAAKAMCTAIDAGMIVLPESNYSSARVQLWSEL